MAPGTRPAGSAGPGQRRPPVTVAGVVRSDWFRRLSVCLGSMLVFAVMTGPAGSNGVPTSGFTGSLQFPRLFWFIGYAAGLFLIVSVWQAFGTSLKAGGNEAKALSIRVTREHWVKLVLDSIIIAVGFIWVSWVSYDDWKGGVCIQIGLALAAMELCVYLKERFSVRVARLAAYAVIAAYGALSWTRGSVPRYLSTIGAVPHDRPLGKVLFWAAVCLVVVEGLLFLIATARKRAPARSGRGWATFAGVVLIGYGWLMGTTSSLWRVSTKHSLARWLSSIHVLPHSRAAGVTIMFLGAALLLAMCAWVGKDMVGAVGEADAGRERYDFSGITTQARFPYAKTALTLTALLVAIEWPLHLNGGVQSILTTQVAVYILLALGLNVVVGFAGLLDLGYVAFWAIGAYTTAFFTGALPIAPPFILNPFWVIPFAIAAAMLAGVLLGTPTLRLRGDYLAIVTLGFGEIIEIVANNLNSVTGGPAGTTGFVPQFSVHMFSVKYQWTGTVLPYYYLILGVAVVFAVGFSFLEHSRVGRSWTAIREDEIAADSLGINALKYKVMAFAIGASTAGFAGVFFASQVQSLVPSDFIVQTSILIVVFVIFGGMGSIAGAVIGAAIIQWLPQYLNYRAFSDYQTQDEYIYLGALVIVLMIFRPQGIIPSQRRRREILLTEQGIGHSEGDGGPVRNEPVTVVPPTYGKLGLDEPGYIGPETE